MIAVKFEEKEKIGLQYALETLHGCSPFGQERIRRLRFYAPEERAALEEELYNVEQAANAAGELKDVYNKLMTGLCQMKDIRNSLRRCAAGETPDHVELFEIKGYLQRLDGMRPLFEQINAVTHFKGMTFHEVKDALAVLDPDGTGSRGFYIPDSATAKLKEIRSSQERGGGTAVPRPDRRGKGRSAPEAHPAVRRGGRGGDARPQGHGCGTGPYGGRSALRCGDGGASGLYYPKGTVCRALRRCEAGADGEGPGAGGYDQSGDLRPAGAAGPPLRAGVPSP